MLLPSARICMEVMIEHYSDAPRLVNDPGHVSDLYHLPVMTVSHFSEVALFVGPRIVFAMLCSGLAET